MWKKVTLLLLIFTSLSCATHPSKSSISSSFNRHDYSVLGEGFGILNAEDIAINDCQATPRPFAEDSQAYSYWQCFDVRQARLYCDGKGYDETERTWLTVMVISGKKDGILHEYITRRAIPLKDCQSFRGDWQRLVDGQTNVCISGSFNQKKESERQQVWNWTFDRFKTNKGCESYFEGGCSFKYQSEHGCKLHGFSQGHDKS